MNSIKQILAIASIGMLLINCPKSKDNDDDLLLGLALLSQQGGPVFTPTTPAFTLADGESAFYSAGPWGKAETKFDIPGLARNSATEVTVNFTGTDGRVRIYLNVERNLTNGGGTAQKIDDKMQFIELIPTGIRGYGKNVLSPRRGTDPAVFIIGGNFAAGVATQKTFCIESHREVEGAANCGGTSGVTCTGGAGADRPRPSHVTLSSTDFRKIEAHHIAWSKPCGELTTADKGAYEWESKPDVESNNTTAYDGTRTELSEWAKGVGIGYTTRNAIVTARPFAEPFGTAGSFR